MKLTDVVGIVEGKVLCCEQHLNREVDFAFSSDLMSDVLTTQVDRMLLLTGLANIQAVRTAEMSDIGCVVFVRNKRVTDDMIDLAKECGIVLVECRWSMFRASGELYAKGLKPLF